MLRDGALRHRRAAGADGVRCLLSPPAARFHEFCPVPFRVNFHENGVRNPGPYFGTESGPIFRPPTRKSQKNTAADPGAAVVRFLGPFFDPESGPIFLKKKRVRVRLFSRYVLAPVTRSALDGPRVLLTPGSGRAGGGEWCAVGSPDPSMIPAELHPCDAFPHRRPGGSESRRDVREQSPVVQSSLRLSWSDA